MTQKVIITLIIICLSVMVASILKFAEKKQMNIFALIISLFMPILLPIFMIKFFMYVYKKDFSSLPFLRKIILALRFILFEIQVTPLIHTTLIEAVCYPEEESNSKVVFPLLKRNTFIKAAVADLHVRISFANNFIS